MNKALKLRIVEKFDSQANFAQFLGIDESYLSRVIRGRKSISKERKEHWAEVLNCKISELFSDEA